MHFIVLLCTCPIRELCSHSSWVLIWIYCIWVVLIEITGIVMCCDRPRALASNAKPIEFPILTIGFDICPDTLHCVKSVQIRSFFWSVFSRIRTEYGSEKLRIWTLFTQYCLFLVWLQWADGLDFVLSQSYLSSYLNILGLVDW